ncbi:LysR family transcriptional regulator [Pendulispora albinea]|uniref:LysR family transcriptional regulator n=1 Tax=Pendulispora albinea TaxID=2741071 RepID=A0ABZ2LSM8_9BACT
MDLNKAATFVQIVEAGGVTAAASRRGLPKSSVSRSLTQLEAELGVQLVLRGGRRFRLTDAGRSFFEAAAAGVAALEEARDGIRDQQSGLHGLVRIAAPTDLGTTLVAPALARFVRAYPDVRIELSLGTGTVDPVRDGFDLAVCMGKLSDSSLIARPLGTVDACILASRGYLEARGTPMTPSDLAAHDCVLYRATGKNLRWELSGPSGTETVRVTGPIHVNDRSAVAAAIAAGAGLGILPFYYQHTAALVRVLPKYMVRGDLAQIVYPASRHVSLRTRLLGDAILEAAKNQCPLAPRSGKKARG